MRIEKDILSGLTYLLILFVPVSSFLIFPEIQGTTPGNILTILCIFLLIFTDLKSSNKFLFLILVITLSWLIFFSFSQLLILLFPSRIQFYGLILINPNDDSIVFRKSLFTQSLYLLMVAIYSLFVYIRYNVRWDKYIQTSAALISIYGIYEVIYYIIFKNNGDFLSNRTFGPEGLNTGSWMQLFAINDIQLIRLKSLTGEPSMYALTILPYLFYGHSIKWHWAIQLVILISLILTFSTSAILGLSIGTIVYLYYKKISIYKAGLTIALISLICVIFPEGSVSILKQSLADKITLNNFSGIDRCQTFISALNFWLNLNLLSQLFGVGFGTIRSTDFFSTLLVNTGLLGLIAFVSLFIFPVFVLGNDSRSIGLKQCLLATLIIMLVSVPEFSYLAPWTFLAMAYNKISTHRFRNID